MKKLFYNGTIHTMAEPATAEAVLTDGGEILAVGPYAALRRDAATAELVDLCGQTMLPAFIDAHSHFSSYATSFLQVPLEECCTFEEIIARIRRFIEQNHVAPGTWVAAKGYDHNALREKRHPTLALADLAAPENPLVLQHASGHVGVLNSLALRALGITAQSTDPAGGRIGRENGGLTGYLEENAFIDALKRMPMNSMADMLAAYRKAQAGYAAHGITTIQEGLTVAPLLPLYRMLLEQAVLQLDLVVYVVPEDLAAFQAAFPDAWKAYRGHLKLGGCKIILDGSPQGRTAWMRTPYLDQTPPYCGYGTMQDADVVAALRNAAAGQLQLLAHCNGDAAAAQFLRAAATVAAETELSALRPVMIHAQLLGTDQLPEVRRLGILLSFFVAHVYHWGDTHIRNFGPARAAEISPAGSALNEGIRFTFHQDTPVIEPDMLETVWCAVNRVTREGVSLGPGERISVLEALKAVTVNAAYQYFEEDSKGSIEPGKRADFVLLDRDPLAVAPMELREIRVTGTVKDAEFICRAAQ